MRVSIYSRERKTTLLSYTIIQHIHLHLKSDTQTDNYTTFICKAKRKAGIGMYSEWQQTWKVGYTSDSKNILNIDLH